MFGQDFTDKLLSHVLEYVQSYRQEHGEKKKL